MRRSFLIIIMSCMLMVSLAAQENPAILVKTENDEYRPLKMSDMTIDVRVVGNLSVTTMDITFYNDLNRVLEGQFYFPLSEGQTISRFALEVNGKLREGVIVERAKGREVYESTIRQQIDPGLLEWTKGNNFKARIYPVPAKGYKRLVIAYEQELKDEDDGFLYLLPLGFKQRVDHFSLKVEVLKQKARPEFSSSNELINVSFKKWKESYIAEMKEKNYLPDKQLAFILPRTKAYTGVSLEQAYGQTYFYLHMNPKIFTTEKTLPKKICLVWDASLSAEKRDIQREFALLEAYLELFKKVKIECVVFRNEVEEKTKTFTIKKGKWDSLRTYLSSLPCDGGTQLGSLDLTDYACDEFIISTDGISTFGPGDITLSSTPVIVINSQLTAEHSYLTSLARKTGGVYINLTKETTGEALGLMKYQPYSFIKAEFKSNEIKDVYPSLPMPVIKDFSLAGILTAKHADIILHFGAGNKTMHTEKIRITKSGELSETGLVPKIWAQKKINELNMEYEKNRAEIIQMGRDYTIVTRDTSLIVLDRLEDYVTHRIVPPKELQQEYYRIINLEEMEKREQERSHISDIIEKFSELKEWWNTKFSWDPPKQDDSDKKRAIEEEERDLMAEESMEDNRGAGDYESRDFSEEPSTIESEDDAMTGGEDEQRSKEKEEKGATGSIELTRWDPDTPYLKVLKEAKKKDLYQTYLNLRKEYPSSSAFYLDVADFFIENQKQTLALRILSNISEMELENHQLLRILGHRLAQLGYAKLGIFVFHQVLKMREEEPQSYRDLGLVYAQDKQYQQAVDYLYEVVKRKWDDRFPDIGLIALVEMNSLIARIPNINTRNIDKRLLKNLPVDIRIVLDWDADNTDMDLWILNPNGEKCYYSNPRTHLGGHMSRDFTRGYGPEEYLLKRAKPGTYTIQVNYYGNTQQILAGATTIQVRLILNFGKKDEVVKEITLRLKDQKEVITVGTFNIKVRNNTVQF